jgi:hypothetical protein
MDMHLGIYYHSEGDKLGIEGFMLGSKVLIEVLFEVLYFCVDGGMHVFIDRGNIGIELSHFLLDFCEIRLQGIEVSFQLLAMGVGHDGKGTRKEEFGTTQKMGDR